MFNFYKVGTIERSYVDKINSLFGGLQAIVVGICAFFAYRQAVSEVGVESLGAWAIIMSSVSLIKIMELGITGSVLFVSVKKICNGDIEKCIPIIRTGVIFASLGAAISLLIFFFLKRHNYFGDNSNLIFIAILCSWSGSIAMVLSQGFMALGMGWIRSLGAILGALAMLMSCMWLIHIFGILGLGIAILIQGLTSFFVFTIVFVILFKGHSKGLGISICDFRDAKEMFVYGLPYQAVMIVQIMADPIIKWGIGISLGLEMVGIFEVGSRVVNQVRSIKIASMEWMSAAFSSGGWDQRSYDREVRSAISHGFIISAALIALSPLVSLYFLREYNWILIEIIAMLGIGMAINIISAPAYFYFVGNGIQKTTLISHLIMLILNSTIIPFFCSIFGGFGIGIGVSLSVIGGSVYTIWKARLLMKVV